MPKFILKLLCSNHQFVSEGEEIQHPLLHLKTAGSYYTHTHTHVRSVLPPTVVI